MPRKNMKNAEKIDAPAHSVQPGSGGGSRREGGVHQVLNSSGAMLHTAAARIVARAAQRTPLHAARACRWLPSGTPAGAFQQQRLVRRSHTRSGPRCRPGARCGAQGCPHGSPMTPHMAAAAAMGPRGYELSPSPPGAGGGKARAVRSQLDQDRALQRPWELLAAAAASRGGTRMCCGGGLPPAP